MFITLLCYNMVDSVLEECNNNNSVNYTLRALIASLHVRFEEIVGRRDGESEVR